MHIPNRIIAVAVVFLTAGWAVGGERDRFADVLALQDAVRQSIARAEPSIACILVSRSPRYRELEGTSSDIPGQLGRFEPNLGGFGRRRREAEEQLLRGLKLNDPDTVPESYGSGVVIDAKKKLVLTLAHVVRKAAKIYVRLPGGRGSWANIHAADPRSDLALLQLIDTVEDLKAIPVGDGSRLHKGDFVLSLSNPFAAGYRDGSPSASWGIISNLRRRSTDLLSDFERSERTRQPLYCFGTLIQTDTRMNLGCSGGAVLNLRGELIGLTTALAGISGGETPGGFALPMNDGMSRILDVLRRGEEVEYGFLGVHLSLPDRTPKGMVQINDVLPGGPAQQGGLQANDFIFSINGEPVHSNDEVFVLTGMHLAGTTVRIEAASGMNGPRKFYRVRLAKYLVNGPVIASRRPETPFGLRVDWTSILPLREERRWLSIPEGVLLREVLPGSPAQKARLQTDMIITHIDKHKVMMPSEFYDRMKQAKGRIELTVHKLDGSNETFALYK